MLLFLALGEVSETPQAQCDESLIEEMDKIVQIWKSDPEKIHQFISQQEVPVVGIPLADTSTTQETPPIGIPIFDAHPQDPKALALTEGEKTELYQFMRSNKPLARFMTQEQKELVLAIGKMAAEKTQRVIDAATELLQTKEKSKKGFLGKIKSAISPDRKKILRGEILGMLLRASEVAAPHEFYPESQAGSVEPELTAFGQILLFHLLPKAVNETAASFDREQVNSILKTIQSDDGFLENIIANTNLIQEFFICLSRYNPPRPDKFSVTNIVATLSTGKKKFIRTPTDKEKAIMQALLKGGASFGGFLGGPVGHIVGKAAGGVLASMVYIAATMLQKK